MKGGTFLEFFGMVRREGEKKKGIERERKASKSVEQLIERTKNGILPKYSDDDVRSFCLNNKKFSWC